jgi:hypothetical protein
VKDKPVTNENKKRNLKFFVLNNDQSITTERNSSREYTSMPVEIYQIVCIEPASKETEKDEKTSIIEYFSGKNIQKIINMEKHPRRAERRLPALTGFAVLKMEAILTIRV